MNNDLISRSALLKELNEYNEFAVFDCEAVKDLIDNAPVVDPTYQMPEDYIKNKLDYERYKGEWKYTTHYARRYRVCPICTAEKEDDRSAGWNFCWHCGADLRGKKEPEE